MAITQVRDIYKNKEAYADKAVTLQGWIRTNRGSKNFGFIELNDGTYYNNIQVVYDGELGNFEAITKFSIASGLEVEGVLVLTPDAKQPFEIKAERVTLVAGSESDYPLQKKRHTFEYLRTIAHLRPRSNTFSAMFRVRSLASFAFHEFFNTRGFVYVHTPIVTSSDCEGAGEMFQVSTLDMKNPPLVEGAIDYSKDFFGKQTSLTVSGQLAVEPFALAFKNVYTFGPTFRAENSNTARHAAEFWMLEPEMAFADLSDNMDLAEEMVKYVTKYLLENARPELEFFNDRIQKGLIDRLEKLVAADFGRVSYTEAVEKLLASGKEFEYPVAWGMDLQTEHERYLTEEIYKKPVFVTDYPKDIKSFYMRLNDDGKTVAACDMLVPGVGELIGGSQREERFDKLVERMEQMGLEKDEYDWYLDTRKYGGVYHSGYGLGFDRYLMYVTGMANIRDTQPYPRASKLADF
ncbi:MULTISPECIES: asparagine--tRNA ligase [unclassified Fusibacter]|uniref:asparagine--tRNA ligase n=1 Tax=unclassified Fusibacter TaxID=2624464 RepID=UPI0010138B9A|nr:asparagine--tRNA ligase [Fusibacter sp. A1]MCK8060995.1 asparagine--tRNA ligase [Fusibacter sp. A2]NPE20551.1 asparagine--tRNA ligase [Fusibacter sp. A1]RXV63748.1 asparagine--tRNA ligase [Fusibacter sp. A1]